MIFTEIERVIRRRFKLRSYQKRYRIRHPDRVHKRNPLKAKVSCKKWRDKKLKENPRFFTERILSWKKKNPSKWNLIFSRWKRKRYKNDLGFRLKQVVGASLTRALKRKGILKSRNTLDLLGAPIQEIKIHIESRFLPGMTWENHGRFGWHIDHVRPCSSFDLSDPEEQKKCFHYTNLQPLWWKDNLKKGEKCLSAW